MELKRSFDIFFSTLALLVLSPFLFLIAFSIRSSMGKPILFRQVRPGLRSVPFAMYKFRTMKETQDSNGLPASDDRRLTPIGKFLRSASLDELPELFNVIKGDMSLVGPRPLLMQYLDRYTPEQARRHEARPGITGWAQINGRNAISWEDKFKLDVWYVDNRSFLLDLKIIALTVWKSIARKDINQPGHATAQEFMGNAREA